MLSISVTTGVMLSGEATQPRLSEVKDIMASLAEGYSTLTETAGANQHNFGLSVLVSTCSSVIVLSRSFSEMLQT